MWLPDKSVFYKVNVEGTRFPCQQERFPPAMATLLAYVMEFASFFTKTHPEMPLSVGQSDEPRNDARQLEGEEGTRHQFAPIKDALTEILEWYRTQGDADALPLRQEVQAID